jgi:hypothetical protein
MRIRCAALACVIGLAASGSSYEQEPPPLRIYGLGDMGEPGPILNRSVEILATLVGRESSPDDAIVYLGDNFYPDGLQDQNKNRVEALIHGVMDSSGLRRVQSALRPGRVFAVPGNHEYYKLLLFGHFPLGFSERGDATRARAQALGWDYAGGRSKVTYLTAPDGARVALFLLDSALAVAGPEPTIEVVMGEFEDHLRRSAHQADWRILAMHHPLESRGDHGHSFDREEEHDWIRRHSFPHKLDTCSRTFQRFAARLHSRIRAAGVPIDAVVSGHDHNLQILDLPERAGLGPRIQIVSGAASKVHGKARRVADREFLASTSGFLELQLTRGRLRAIFHGQDEPCLKGGGAAADNGFTAFEVSRSGGALGVVRCSPPVR